MVKNIQKIILFSVSLALLFSVSLAVPAKAQSASLYLSPSSGNYTVGNTFLVQFKVNSGGVAINAADGTLVFNPDKLEVISISKTDSVFSLWVQEPTFSNSLGTITYAGGKPSPGFTGASGVIINITFKARTAGTANLTFAAGSILADDGKGTNILSNLGGGTFTLSGKTVAPLPTTPPAEEYAPVSTPGGVPAAPIVYSSTHPEENKWYSNSNPEFSWKLPADVTGVSLMLHQKATANPGPNSDGLITSKKFEDIEDGIWYFHIKFRNQYGWGKITHRKVLIDIEQPKSFEVTVDDGGDPTCPTPTLYFGTTDTVSGLEYYEVKLSSPATSTLSNVNQTSFTLLPRSPGKHIVDVKAFDKAGNATLSSTEFEILSIATPEITKIPISIKIGESLKIEGEAKPELTVRIYLQKTGEQPILEKVKVDAAGKFMLIYEKTLTKGDYLVWAQTEDERGAVSYPTEKYSLEVGLPPFIKLGKIALDYLSIMTTLIVLIVGAIAIIFYTWYRISLWRKRMRKETKEVAESVARAFKALKEEVEEQIEFLDEKPGLTKAERKVRDKLKEALDISEEFIGKEIKDVEKELE